MAEYEITYLSNPGLSEDARAELDRSIDDTLEKLEGSASFASPNTRRRLAYPLKKQPVGFARTLQITLDPAKIEELRQSIRKTEGVLRVAVLATPRREELTPAIFDAVAKPAEKTEPAKPAKPVTMEEVEEKIEEALTEEVK